MNQDAKYIRQTVIDHTNFFGHSLPMIASENLLSPLAKEMLISDFHNRYAEGIVGDRYYEGNRFVDMVEQRAIELSKKIFTCKYADVRPVSGTVANIATYFALTKPGDLVSAPALADGGHITAAPFGALGLRGLSVVNYPFDIENMNIDVPATEKMLIEKRPKVALFGHSALLFPTPIKELVDVFDEINCRVWYDAAHVLGLIGGGYFQDPLREGVEVVTGSTHKTLPGPQHGMIIANPRDDDTARALSRGVFPGVTSNHHLHAMAALGIALAEQMEFGKEYSRQIIANAKALGEAMHERGIAVLCPHIGFTESHILLLDVSGNGGGQEAASNLSKANIVVNMEMLPWDKSAKKPSGVRIGTQELTRLGMKEKDMIEIADLFKRVLVDRKDPKTVAPDVSSFRKNFNEIHYCFASGSPAYKYLQLVKEK